MNRPVAVAIIGAYAVAVLTLHYDFPEFRSPNERSRLYLLEAIVRDRTLSIDQALARHGDMEDKVAFAEHTYSNKPPGLVMLALPWYVGATLIADDALPLDGAMYVARVGSVTVPTLAFLAMFAGYLRRRGLSESNGAVLLVGVAFGSGMFPYGALFMAHATSAALLGMATLLLLDGGLSGIPDAGSWRRSLIAALLAILAVACEYPVALPATVLLSCAVWRLRSLRALLAIVAGALPSAVLVLGYNVVVFGNPLDLGYSHHIEPGFAAVHASGLYGFHLPTAQSLYGLSLSVSHGLWSWSPWLLLALPGAIAMFRTGRAATCLVLVAASLSLFLFIAGYPNWHGGWAVGPRYLLPCVPLLAILVAEAVASGPPLWATVAAGLVAFAVVAHVAVACTWPYLPDLLGNPLFDLTVPLLRAWELAPTFIAPHWLGVLLVAGAGFVGFLVSLRVAPVRSLALAIALLMLTSLRTRTGPVRFCLGEVLFVRGSYAASRRSFEQVLAQENVSPAMSRHIKARLATIERLGHESALRDAVPGAGSNIENRVRPD